MLGRAHSVGADVYLGPNEANSLVGSMWGGGGGRGQFDAGRFSGGGDRHRFVDANRFGGGGANQWGNPGENRREERHERHEVRREEWEAAHPGDHWEERERRRLEWERMHPGVPFVGMAALMGAVEANHQSLAQMGIHPRAALVPAAPPHLANREPLPMSTGTAPVGIGLTAQITSRPQRVGFRPERLFVSSFSLDGLGATAWTINDITIGNVSQLAQAGNLPGDMFSNVAIDSFVTFKTAQTAMDVVLITTYNGTTEGGIPFTGAVIGLSAQS